MRRFVSAGIALSAMTLVLASTQAAHAQSLINNFETPALAAGTFSYGTTGNAATFTGTSGISSNNSAFTSGNPLTPDGTQVAFIQNTASFTQTFTAASASPTAFTFFAARRGNLNSLTESFNVLLNGSIIGSFAPTSTTYTTFTTSTANTLVGSNTLTFTGTSAASGGDSTVFIDRITGPAAPEPGSLALLLPVVGTVGMVLRRRRK